MEDILDLYKEPYNPKYPVVCFDEKSYQLIGNKNEPIKANLNHPELEDYEYVRNGTTNLFIIVEPKCGKRHVKRTNRRTKKDFANIMKYLVQELYPNANKIRVVLDNLNTHKPAVLYEWFEPEEAREIVKKLDFHYTPKHASWLNMAEIEISVLMSQCLSRRIATIDTIEHEIAVWQKDRNQNNVKIKWGFSVKKARKKLHRFYSKLT